MSVFIVLASSPGEELLVLPCRILLSLHSSVTLNACGVPPLYQSPACKGHTHTHITNYSDSSYSACISPLNDCHCAHVWLYSRYLRVGVLLLLYIYNSIIIRVYGCIYTCMYVLYYTCMCTYIHAYIIVCMRACVCVRACVFIWEGHTHPHLFSLS